MLAKACYASLCLIVTMFQVKYVGVHHSSQHCCSAAPDEVTELFVF